MKHAIRSIISSSLGNILEWYDFGLFAIFSPLFSHLFFPTTDPNANLLVTFMIFAIGFICRPLGSLLFGYLGDKHGRANTLRFSILMISIPTLLIGFLPTYQEVGVLAPILLTLIRVWQGISLGGEFSGNLIYLAETAPKHTRATLTSFAPTGANLGVIFATGMSAICFYIFSKETLHAWGWRVPYIFSGVLSLFVYTTRLQIDETRVFEYLKQKKLLVKNPIKIAFRDNIPQMLRTLGLICLGSNYYYFCFIYLPVLIRSEAHEGSFFISEIMAALFFAMLVLVPASGYLCDYLGRRKMLLFNASMVALLIVPCFFLIQTMQVKFIILGLSVLTILSSLEQATTCIAVVENYPVLARYTGLSVSYNLGSGFLGGTIPLVSTWLQDNIHFAAAPALYIVLSALVTLLVTYFFVPETKEVSLR